MKKQLLLFTFGCLLALGVRGQTPVVDLQFMQDSTWNGNCSQSSIDFFGNFTTQNVPSGTNLQLIALFGDGTSDTSYHNSSWGWVSTSHTYTSPGTYTPIYYLYGPGGSGDTLVGNSMTIVVCGDVSGTIYLDNNNNCSYDGGDSPLPNHFVSATLNGTYVGGAMTDPSGNYSMQVPPGSILVKSSAPTNGSGQIVTCPTNNSHTVTTLPATGIDFGYSCPVGTDVAAYGYVSQIKPGNLVFLGLLPQNTGCGSESGTISITESHPDLVYTSSSTTPAAQSGDTITWNFTGASGNSWNPVTLWYYASSSITVGDTVCFVVTVNATNTDVNPSNDVYTVCAVVVSSYDPNMKEGWSGVGANGAIVAGQEMTYTIHFQNTGTASADEVYILDNLPAELNPTSLQLVTHSHPMQMHVYDNNKLKFEFNNINLPDSASDEPGSKGFVTFHISAYDDLPEGTTIENGASIYFDYNDPIITNFTHHQIDSSEWLSIIPQNAEAEINIYPNPNHGMIFIENPYDAAQFNLYDLQGRIVKTQQLGMGVTSMHLTELSQGAYIYSIIHQKGRDSGKLIIE